MRSKSKVGVGKMSRVFMCSTVGTGAASKGSDILSELIRACDKLILVELGIQTSLLGGHRVFFTRPGGMVSFSVWVYMRQGFRNQDSSCMALV